MVKAPQYCTEIVAVGAKQAPLAAASPPLTCGAARCRGGVRHSAAAQQQPHNVRMPLPGSIDQRRVPAVACKRQA